MSDRSRRTWATMVARHAALARPTVDDDAPPDHRPEVAILACSDARVPPSLVFGLGPGDAFVVRIAGNSATPGAIASLAYAVEQLGVELVVVLGHTGCGAVTAALVDVDPGSHTSALAPILTPIDEMLAACDACDDVDAAVAANVRHNVSRLERDRGPLGAAIADGRATVCAAVHDLTTGRLVDLEQVGRRTVPVRSRLDIDPDHLTHPIQPESSAPNRRSPSDTIRSAS